MPKFHYPVNNAFDARAVTEPTFEEDIFASDLYVNLDDVRGNQYLNEIRFDLGVDDTSLHLTEEYVKLIFSGHIGSGKTVELQRLHQALNIPSLYFSIFISLEEELEISRFEPEDFYVLLITKLITQLKDRGINRNTVALQQLSSLFFSDEEVVKEISESNREEIEFKTEAGLGFLDFFKIGGSLKNLLAGETKTAKTIREVTRKNLLHLTQLLNDYINDIRQEIQQKGIGQDILFVIDGSEKILFEQYETLFVKNANVLNTLNTNMIMSVRIDAFYSIENAPISFTSRYVVPMIRTDKPENMAALCEVIKKRIDFDTFFADQNTLESCVRFSGGCIRQLFQIVNHAIRKTRGKQKIDEPTLQAVVYEMGNSMRERIDKSYIELLKEGNFEPAEAKVKEMLYGLLLLKYNGKEAIDINPILKNYLQNANEL